jgi:hypothetical protein
MRINLMHMQIYVIVTSLRSHLHFQSRLQKEKSIDIRINSIS